MSEKKVERRTVQSSPLPLQFTCWSADGGSELILSQTGLMLQRQGTVALFIATGLCSRGRYDPTWPSSIEQSEDAAGASQTSSRPQVGEFLGERARPPILLLLLHSVANSRLGCWFDPVKLQIKLFLSLHELFSKAALISSSENPWKTFSLLFAIFSSSPIVSLFHQDALKQEQEKTFSTEEKYVLV